MVVTIQVLRGLSAIAIVVYHVTVNQYGEKPGLHVLSAGVDVFFVISGYIIARSTEEKVGPGRFIVRRFLRIYPVWWAALGLWLIGSHLVLGSTATPSDILSSFALVLTWNEENQLFAPLYHIGWSLCYEVTFYTLWALSIWLALLLRVRVIMIAIPLIGILTASVWITVQTVPAAHALRPYASPFMLEFLGGAVIRYAETRGLLGDAIRVLGRWFTWLCASAAIAGFTTLAWGFLPSKVTAIPALFAFLMFLSMRVDRSSVLSRLGVYLGDASYSIYLFHALLLDLVFVHAGLLSARDSDVVYAVVAFTTCFAFSLAMYHMIEKPCIVAGKYLTSSWRHPLQAAQT